MMEFIFVPLVVWICVSGVYGLFELYARRKERLALIEKMGEKVDNSLLGGGFNVLNLSFKSFSSLKIGCLLMGLGLGLLVGLLISAILYSNNFYSGMDNWRIDRYSEVAYGASVLLFGGVGLLISFLVENKLNRKEG
ncbi:MAG: hypothetical protein LBE79_10100 [Tannerella sp.]|jgi:hypothetical protein|nr:hypothetical protein [Tannerella sp.]